MTMIKLIIRESWNLGDDDTFRETGMGWIDMMVKSEEFDKTIIVNQTLDGITSHNQYIVEFNTETEALEFNLKWL